MSYQARLAGSTQAAGQAPALILPVSVRRVEKSALVLLGPGGIPMPGSSCHRAAML
jgi:hypothetical protein